MRNLTVSLTLFIFSLSLLNVSSKLSEATPEEIRDAILKQYQTYPLLTINDIYKTHYQDAFGPGHLLSDITIAREYIINETRTMADSTYALHEPTGAKGNYIRVNLQYVKNQTLNVNVLVMALVRSADYAEKPENWPEIWMKIEKIVNELHLNLPHYEEDIQKIHEALKGTNWAIDHSREYVKAYDPHYRIIYKDIYENEIKPIIEK